MSQSTEIEAIERRFPELTEKEEAFVWELLVPDTTDKAAAIRAGYAAGSAHVTASRLKRKPTVIRAMHEASVITLGSLAPAAVNELAKLGVRAKSEYVRLEASKDVLDRLGMTAPKQVRVGGQVSFSIDLS